jgi:ATP-binding cassette, subfamily B, bacterial
MAQSPSPVIRLWRLLQEEKSDIVAIYVFAILSGLIQLSLPLGIQAIIGFVLGGTLSASLVMLISVLVAAVLFTGIIQVNQMKIIEKVQQKIFVRYAYAFTDRIPRLDLKKIDGFYLPELVNRFFETVSLQKGFSKILLDIPTATIQILFGLILLSFYHTFFIVFGLLLLFLLWLMVHFTGNKGLQSSLEESVHKYRVAAWLEETARLVKTFKFSRSGLHFKRADQKTVNYLQARTTHFNVLKFQYKVLIIFKVAITAAMLTGGVLLLLNQQINIGQFVAAEIIIIAIIASIEKIIVNLDSVYDVMTAVEKISKLTDKPVEEGGSYQLTGPAPVSVSARQLGFTYETGRPVISKLDFTIAPGEKVCISGTAGSGKSTLLKLLTGAYKGFNGSLLINNIPIGNYDLASLRERMGILFLQEDIFQGTLWDNLTMGKANISKDYVARLCEITGLQKFLASLPDGYDTQLDPAGKRLPKSVVQKILLVRAMAHQPSLLILEEPWQGLNGSYRKNIQELLLNAKDTTVIISTSDEAFAKQCNQVIHLENFTAEL